jgi:hypothetical protein
MDDDKTTFLFCRLNSRMKEDLKKIARKRKSTINKLVISELERFIESELEKLIEADKKMNQINYPNRFE